MIFSSTHQAASYLKQHSAGPGSSGSRSSHRPPSLKAFSTAQQQHWHGKEGLPAGHVQLVILRVCGTYEQTGNHPDLLSVLRSPVQHCNCIYSCLLLSLTKQLQLEFSTQAQQPEQIKCMSRFAALYAHREIYRVLTTALTPFCGESSLIQMTSTRNYFYIR